MTDTILVYCLPQEIKEKIEGVGEDLNIVVREIMHDQIHQKMGSLLELDGYSFEKTKCSSLKMKEPFVFFALNNDEQLEIILQMFHLKGIPFIPYKAILTPHNVDYTFEKLYQSVAEEYFYMTKKRP